MMTVVMLPRSQKVERHIRPRWPSRCVRKTKARSKGQAPEEPAARRMPRAGPTEAAGPGSAIGSYFGCRRVRVLTEGPLPGRPLGTALLTYP
jgi:hypothetical protein